MATNYDLVVIGAGMAGVAAANKCSPRAGRSRSSTHFPYGDLCAQRVRSEEDPSLGREIIGSAQLMRGKGIDDTALSINWSDLMRHRRGFTDPLPQNLERDLANRSRHRC